MQDAAAFAMTLAPGLQVFLGLATAFLLGAAAGYMMRVWQEDGLRADDAPPAGPPARAGARRAAPEAPPAAVAAPPADISAPAEQEESTAAGAARAPGRSTSASRRPASRRRSGASGVTVLVADDRTELLALHGAYLERHGYRVLTATDGNAALALARSEHPAVIVLDHSMPGRSGIEVTRELKADPATADIPVLLMTAHSYGAVGANARAAGIASFMTKPCDPSRLLREVATFVAPGAGAAV